MMSARDTIRGILWTAAITAAIGGTVAAINYGWKLASAPSYTNPPAVDYEHFDYHGSTPFERRNFAEARASGELFRGEQKEVTGRCNSPAYEEGYAAINAHAANNGLPLALRYLDDNPVVQDVSITPPLAGGVQWFQE